MTRRSLFGTFLAALLAPLARWFGKGDAVPFRTVGHLSEREWLDTLAKGWLGAPVGAESTARVVHVYEPTEETTTLHPSGDSWHIEYQPSTMRDLGCIELDVTDAVAEVERLGKGIVEHRDLTDDEVRRVFSLIKMRDHA